jgi:hypothetical protein
LIGCLEAGIDWLLVLRQAVRHLLERYTASTVDVDSDKARLTELYTAHDATLLEHVDSTLAEHKSQRSRDAMWRRMESAHPGFFENESEGGPLQIGTLTAEHPSKYLWVDRNKHVHVLAHLAGLGENATIRDVAVAMGAGRTGEECKGLSRLAEEYIALAHEFPSSRAKMAAMSQEVEAGLRSSGFRGFDRNEWANDMLDNVCPAVNSAWLETRTTRDWWCGRARLAAKVAVLPAGYFSCAACMGVRERVVPLRLGHRVCVGRHTGFI